MFCNQCGMDTGNEAPFCVKCGGRSIETVSMPSAGIGAATAPARSPAPQLLAKGPEPDLAVWVLLPIMFLAGWCTVAGIRQLQRRPATSQVEQIANTPVTLNPDGYYYKFKVPPGARHAIVEGHFSTAGGPGNEIEAYILRKDDFEGWWNGEHRPTIYQSGKCMQSTIKARLPAGDVYYLVLSNQVSKASSKVVLIDVTLTYNL